MLTEVFREWLRLADEGADLPKLIFKTVTLTGLLGDEDAKIPDALFTALTQEKRRTILLGFVGSFLEYINQEIMEKQGVT